MTREEIIEQYPIALAEKEGKQIQYLHKYTNKWIDCSGSAIFGQEKLRIKPEQTKRLPTIEDVEKWFLENKVFAYNETGTYERIMTFQKTHETPICNYDKEWLSIKEFCQLYSNIDGTELYITEN